MGSFGDFAFLILTSEGVPQSAGRTLKERQRRQYVDARLDELGREISHLRLELKRCF